MSNSRRNSKLALNDTSLFSFSSILSTKYPKGRVAPSATPQHSNQRSKNTTATKPINVERISTTKTVPTSKGLTTTESPIIIDIEQSCQSFCQSIADQTISTNHHVRKQNSNRRTKNTAASSGIINIEQSYQSFCQSIADQMISTDLHVQKENPNKKDSKKKRHRFRRLLPCIIILLVVFLGISIAAIFLAILYGRTPSTTTTTTTTTTYTSATTTTTSTTSTTSTTTTTTSTSTSTTSTSTTSTTSTTTTETTTTTTTETTTTVTTPGCYFGDDYVDLIEGGRRRISNLKAGDRVWTLSNDGKHLIEDEVMVIPHAGPNTPTYFYTFTTIEGHTISLTDTHFIFVFTNGGTQMKIICASQVTLEDQLIMAGRTIGLKKIVYSERIGFYSPITLTGYLLVNNLSTSVYVDYFHETHEFHHRLGGPARVYYRIIKWLFGKDYKPFATSAKEELHPLSTFIIDNYRPIRLFIIILPFMISVMFIILMIYLTQRIFLWGMDYCYLKMTQFIGKLDDIL